MCSAGCEGDLSFAAIACLPPDDQDAVVLEEFYLAADAGFALTQTEGDFFL